MGRPREPLRSRGYCGFGYDRDDLNGLNPDESGAFDFTGGEFNVSCKHDTYQGTAKEKWSLFKSKKLSKDRFLALSQRFSPKVKEMKSQQPIAVAAVTEPKKDAKDIPF